MWVTDVTWISQYFVFAGHFGPQVSSWGIFGWIQIIIISTFSSAAFISKHQNALIQVRIRSLATPQLKYLHPPNIGLIFKTMWKFPHDSPSDFIQTKIVPTSTTNKLDLTIRATSSRYKGLFNNVHQWHQSPISVNWCPSSLFLKDFVHTNFVNIWSGLQRSYKMSQSYVLSNIQTFTWE